MRDVQPSLLYVNKEPLRALINGGGMARRFNTQLKTISAFLH